MALTTSEGKGYRVVVNATASGSPNTYTYEGYASSVSVALQRATAKVAADLLKKRGVKGVSMYATITERPSKESQ